MKEIWNEILNRITLNKILIAIIIFLGVIIMGTTLAVATRPKDFTVVKAQAQTPAESKTASYKNIGRIRTVTASKKNENGTTVVLTPLLSYTKGDEEFFEELSRKNAMIKSVFINYFSSQTAEELKRKDDAQIKKELSAQINELLVLNKIQDIYFEDLIFLD